MYVDTWPQNYVYVECTGVDPETFQKLRPKFVSFPPKKGGVGKDEEPKSAKSTILIWFSFLKIKLQGRGIQTPVTSSKSATEICRCETVSDVYFEILSNCCLHNWFT